MIISKHVAIASVVMVSAVANANLVFNGSFEINSDSGGTYGGESDTADGWTQFNDVYYESTADVWDNGGIDGLLPGSYGFFGRLLASEGTNFASIASQSGDFSEGVESTAMLLSTGTTYRVSVAMAYDSQNTAPWTNPAPLTVRLRQGTGVSFILTTMAANTLDATWQTRTFDFTVGATDSYTLILSSEFRTAPNYIVIDDASIVAVPEPASLVAMGLGVLALSRKRLRAR